MAKVLVTGGSGFIGLHLLAALAERGDEITCLLRKTCLPEHAQRYVAKIVHGDITDRNSLAAAVSGKEIVYHLAGLTRADNPKRFYQVNQYGTGNVVAACAAQNNPPVLILVSSLAVMGPCTDREPKRESDRPRPVSHYGRSKRGGELAAARMSSRLPITIIRPPIVFGEYDRMCLPLFRTIARLGVHFTPGFCQPRYSLVHAADLVRLLILAAERGERLPPLFDSAQAGPQGYYFAVSEQSPYYTDFGRMIAAAVGRRGVWIFPTPGPLLWVLATAGELFSRLTHLPVSLDIDKAREIAAGSWVCSADKAVAELNFSPSAPIMERIRQTAEWYRRAGWL